MDTLKNPAIVGCIVLLVVIICLAIFFYRQTATLQEKVINLENVLSTTIKEMGDLREHKKAIPWLSKSLQDHGGVINSLTENNSEIVKEVKYLRKCLTLVTTELNTKGIAQIKFPKNRKKPVKRNIKKKKGSVSFEDDSSESSASESESGSDSEDEVSAIKKRLAKMKKKHN